MRMTDIIEKKRDGKTLTKEEIEFFIKGYVKGDIPDYQASAFTMAVIFQGMNDDETSWLTDAMMHSGDTIDLTSIYGIKVDKHSTGGVGDKTSLAVGPLVAACGAKFAKMSGRGLGHTGGTLDKLESIPGMNVFKSEKEFINQVNSIGIAIIGQTTAIDPADKKLYALRDVTGTVPSIPLIVSSIMSKKLAAGANTILLDVKFGSGAFMKTIDDARILATKMVTIGKKLGRDTRAVLTDMDQPLGLAVGNSLEVIEAIKTLKGEGPKDFVELVTNCGAIILEQAKIAKDNEEGKRMIKQAIDDRSGFKKLVELIGAQGGDISYIEDYSKFPVANIIKEIKATEDGYITHIDSLAIGEAAMKLGAGRESMADVIDMSAGIVLAKKVGDKVHKGDLIATAYTNKTNVDFVFDEIGNAFVYSNDEFKVNPIVHEYIK